MPIRKRPEGAYEVSASWGGRTLRRSSRHWTFQDARHVERSLLEEIRAAAAGREPERLIADALARWLEEHVPRLRSAQKVRNHARALLPFIRGRKLSDIPKVWAEVKAAMVGNAPATVNHRGRILRQVGRSAAREWGWLPSPPTVTLLTETPREWFLTLAQVNALAKAMPSKAGAAYVRLAAYTGIRRGHLLRLTADDVKGDWVTLDRTGKTRRLQQVPLHPKVRAIAKRLPLALGDWGLAQEWKIARAACGLEHVRWHDLRHTCASWLVQAGVPLTTVRDFLGHSTISQTQRYAHHAPEHLKSAVLKLA